MINKQTLKTMLKSSTCLATIVVVSGWATSALSTTAKAAPWGGLYLGAHVGAGEANFDGIFESSDSAVEFEKLELDGILAGGHAGYNWDQGMLVFGIEADFSAMDWSDTVQSFESSEHATVDIDLLASIRGRVGVTLDEERKGLLYLTAGGAYAVGEVVVRDDSPEVCPTCTVGNEQEIDYDAFGGVVGGGFEWAAADPIRLRVESLYYIFDHDDGITLTDANTGDFVEFENVWTFRFGITYYLN